jgi:hypothetical protein
VLAGGVESKASLLEYYVGVDGWQTITTGDYAGLSNPNYNRLTFLFAHPNETDPSSNHYHGIGAWSYSGPAGNPLVNATNTNNRIPEGFSGQGPLPLVPGTGVNAGRWVSQAIPGLEYSDLQWGSTQSLKAAAPGTPEHFLFTSSSGRWMGELTGSNVALALVNVTPGLQVAGHTGTPILSTNGQIYELGDGNLLSFRPSFFATEATQERYSAAFRLLDLNGTFLDSGTFHIDFVQAPEPATLWLVAPSLACIVGLARWRVGRA